MTSPRPDGTRAVPPARIERRQLVALFGYSLVIWSLGNGILPLLPLFAFDFGANDFTAGVYLAVSYAAIAMGTLVAGWTADRFGHRRTMMLLAGVAGSPIVMMTTFVTTFPQLILLTAATWWVGGMAISLTSILGGLCAGPQQRGLILGVLAAAAPVGSVLGGLGVGPLADALGFSRMWIALGLLWLVCPAIGLFVRDATGEMAPSGPAKAAAGELRSAAFLLLFVCATLASVGSFVSALGRSYAMRELGFNKTAITSTVAASGLATFLFPPFVGHLSDRIGRVRFLALCYAAGTAGLVVYTTAATLPAFWLAAVLVAFVSYVSTGVGSALVVDLVDRPLVGRGLALFGATGWIGAIIGFTAGGAAFGQLGNYATFLLGAGAIVVALALLPAIARGIRARRGRAAVLAAPESRKG